MVAFVDAHRHRWPVLAMCLAIELPERSYYAAHGRAASARSVSDEAHKGEIRRVWESNYRCYGPRRVYKQLCREGYDIARCTVVRLMAHMDLRGVQRGKKRYTTTPDAKAMRPPDLVERHFVADRPHELWLADITYASTWEGWLYVSFVLDVYSRAIVGWQIADHLRTELVLDALEMAIWRREHPDGALVHHSDYAEDRVKPRNRGVGLCRQGLLTGLRLNIGRLSEAVKGLEPVLGERLGWRVADPGGGRVDGLAHHVDGGEGVERCRGRHVLVAE